MAIYRTTSLFTDLVGTMDVDTVNNDVNSYTSTTKGPGTPANIGTKGTLEFTVYFDKGGPVYTIDATANGTAAYAGEASSGGPTGGEEPWSATASNEEPATQKAAY